MDAGIHPFIHTNDNLSHSNFTVKPSLRKGSGGKFFHFVPFLSLFYPKSGKTL
ncbi:hypothetical protein AB434_2523 [Heyndrickxia coagulans]|uniref:Uncharacterized protein n=1 Tax=Heyndrickxia coagulans TaxID=1398 RepID=A0A0C5CDG9_HEYCO|nr:hypothetical protein BCO26_0953 [Heyndrickxia coagulans 2-6]AJO23575.1 hypothetical protein SB48_HM08orf04430 [Heyndrickxia coagulans]AKN54928.1 hypothetical protein AB434_2523 [Heyndrickxia coagulans]KWZ77226.1 hypothetical protein HMPREF3213_03415 [Heyndrickxia coagulans]KYC63530.1 hypothetical protein B4100_0181 [Heyndrickxia coagulans]